MKALSSSQERAQEQVQVKFNYQEYHQFEFKEIINSFYINDKQLIIFFKQNEKLKIMDLNRQKQVKQITFKYCNITQIEQSFNQKLFFLIDALGKVIIMRNDRYFKQMNSIKFNYKYVKGLKQLDSSKIITAHNGYLVITNILLRKEIFCVISYQSGTTQIEYDCINNVIITAARQQIKIFKLNGEKIINQQSAPQDYDYIWRIFLTKDNNLNSVTINVLKLWKIDYMNKSLILLNCINSDNLVYLMQTVDKKKLFLIDENHIKFIDHNLRIEYQEHLFYNFSFQNYFTFPTQITSISNKFIAVLCLKKNRWWINILKSLI